MDTLSALRTLGLFDATAPRFTSFPPANWFSGSVGENVAANWLGGISGGTELSLYVHIPFCKRLCWFCACRTQGTRSKAPLEAYVTRLLTEAALVRRTMSGAPVLRRLHFGGGTPTILPAPLLDRLLGGLGEVFGFRDLDEFSVEIDPTDVGPRRLQSFRDFGMSRASIGIQDFDPDVQAAIGREQSFEITRDVVAGLLGRGVDRINFDLLYGLPHQTERTLSATLDAALMLRPSRIALFGYAHVPWASKRQVLIPQEALPDPEERFALFEYARDRLEDAGFVQIGIDHFARPDDSLARASHDRRLRRSFQGYTDDRTGYLVALGASGISSYPGGFVQNLPGTGQYSKAVEAGGLPVWRGYVMMQDDLAVARVVEDLMCYFSASIPDSLPSLAATIRAPDYPFRDAVDWNGRDLVIRDWARPLVRIIAAGLSLDRRDPSRDVHYSRAI